MPSTNEALRDAILRRDIRIRKVGNTLAREALTALIELQRELEARVRARLGWIAERGYASSSFTLRRLEANLRELKAIIKEAYREIGVGVRAGTREAARFEGAFLTAEMTRALGPAAEMLAVRGLAPELLRAIIDQRPFQGATFKGWIAELSERSFQRFSKSMRQGMLLGESVDQLVRRTFGRATRVGGQWIRRGGAFEATTREADTWVRSYMMHTTNSARSEFYNTNASLMKGVQWLSTLDSRVCELCAPRDGFIYSMDDRSPVDGGPSWDEGPGALHPNCIVGSTSVLPLGGLRAVTSRRYEGPVYIIETASGFKLTCTPNHPILTGKGWVAAAQVNEGDDAICKAPVDSPDTRQTKIDHHKEPSIEQVAEAFSVAPGVSSVSVPVAPEDFHGDGVGSNVAVVRAKSLLADEQEPTTREELMHLLLSGAHVRVGELLASGGGLAHSFESRTDSGESLLGPNSSRLELAGRHRLPASEHAFASVSRPDPVSLETRTDRAACEPRSLGDELDALSATKPGDNVVLVGVYPEVAGDSGRAQGVTNGTKFKAQLGGDFSSGLSTPVTLDKIVHVDRIEFYGIVYNLECSRHAYLANGIVTHNCRCTSTPVIKSLKELGLSDREDELPERFRQSMNGLVPAKTNFREWVSKQGFDTQADLFGVRRARLIQQGKLDVDEMWNDKGMFLTLDKLKEAG